MARVLVTGDSGFVGSAVAIRLLRQGHHVVGLDPSPAPGNDWPHLIDDLSDRDRLLAFLLDERITHVIHAGGVSGPMVLADDPAKVIAINVGGSLNLIQACLGAHVKTFVYCSSVSAVGDFYETLAIPDDFPLRPSNTYGCSKAAVDMVLRGLWKHVPLDLCSLRLTSVYGPGRRTSLVIDDIVDAALRGEAVCVEPTGDWPYIYIDDAADAVVAACFSQRRRQLHYFISYPEQVTLEQIAAAAGATARLTIGGALPAIRRGPLDIGPAQRDFGFDPKVDHRLGIRRMIETRRSRDA